MNKALPVRILGMDSAGKPVNLNATTMDISRRGVRLRGVHSWNAPGETVVLSFGSERARYKIIWVGQVGTLRDGQIGLTCIQPDKHIFASELSSPEVAPQSTVVAAKVPLSASSKLGDKRRHPRFACAGGIRIHEKESTAWQWAEVRDISLSGCYVATYNPFAEGTAVEMQLDINQLRALVHGTVKTVYRGFGMGIEFNLTPESREKVEAIIGTLGGEGI